MEEIQYQIRKVFYSEDDGHKTAESFPLNEKQELYNREPDAYGLYKVNGIGMLEHVLDFDTFILAELALKSLKG